MGIEQLENYLIVIVAGMFAILAAIALVSLQIEGIKRRVSRLQSHQKDEGHETYYDQEHRRQR